MKPIPSKERTIMLKSILKTVCVLTLMAGVTRGIIYLASAVSTQRQVTEVNQRAKDPKSDPILEKRVARNSFVEACDTGEYDSANFDQTKYCECTFDQIEQRFGVNHLISSGLNRTEEEMLSVYEKEYKYCIRLQGIDV